MEGYQSHLHPDIKRAENEIASIRKMNRLNGRVLGMNQSTLMELRRCADPPHPTVHRVLQALFLLLGKDEGKTDVRL